MRSGCVGISRAFPQDTPSCGVRLYVRLPLICKVVKISHECQWVDQSPVVREWQHAYSCVRRDWLYPSRVDNSAPGNARFFPGWYGIRGVAASLRA